ncbi:hypothetical protein PSHT_15855 [Puccinia striiformis]|uniref:Uncharacterized protein n=1 Tax=Puccinia striiformis TaxID=27350 RepID=A0A2S4UCV2_9BASI|nr:hypothetical protein PSHT_15855 [Puccinia striiformis]
MHPGLMILLFPTCACGMLLVKISILLLVHPAKTCIFLVLCVTAMYFLDIVDSIVALVLPFKPFHLLFSHIKSSSRNTVEAMITCLWNITKGFGNTLYGHRAMRCRFAPPESLHNPSVSKRYELFTSPYFFHIVEKLRADVKKTLESAYNLLAEQDKTSILFHKEITFLQNARYTRGLWIFQKGDVVISQSKLGKPKAQLKCFGKAEEAFHLQQELSVFSPQVYLSNVVDETTGLELMFENFGELSWKSN